MTRHGDGEESASDESRQATAESGPIAAHEANTIEEVSVEPEEAAAEVSATNGAADIPNNFDQAPEDTMNRRRRTGEEKHFLSISVCVVVFIK